MIEEKMELIPDAHLLLMSLRSVGYKTETAIADIIDNSISAEATEVHVDFIWGGNNSKIFIWDNGHGMSHDELITSMRIGSANPLDERASNDLGRFGMGMKTAAFSLGKRLFVMTKNGDDVSNATWDLSFIENSQDGKWNLLVNGDATKYQNLIAGVGDLPGFTMLVIDELDRLIDSDNLEKSKKSFFRIVENVKKHVGMIFHRFIEEDGLQIFFGEDLVEAWNPFIINNSATQELSEEEHWELDKKIVIQPYVLPHKTKFSNAEEYENAQGHKGWNAHQGVYVYRNRRLLVYGTWFDFLKKEPAFNLARIKLDITSASDYDWKIDIKKSVATPPLYIRDMLERAIMVCTSSSAKVYNSRGAYSKNPTAQHLGYVWEQRKNRAGAYSFYVNKKHPLLIEINKRLDDDGKDILKAYMALIESYAPFMQSGLAGYIGDSKKNLIDESEKAADIMEAKSYIRRYLENGFSREEVENIVLGMPNYKYIEDELKILFEEENYD